MSERAVEEIGIAPGRLTVILMGGTLARLLRRATGATRRLFTDHAQQLGRRLRTDGVGPL